MASLSISSIADVFPATTSVGAYPATGWSQAALPPSGAPPVSATASGTVASDGSLSITGLADATDYYLGASVGGTWRYRRARTPVAAAINVPAGGTAGQALVKNSSTDGDASWSTLAGLPGAVIVAAPTAVAATDKAAIDAAITACEAQARGGVVLLQAGSYATTGGHTHTTKTRIVGAGVKSTVITHTGGGQCFTLSDPGTTEHRVGYEGFELIGDATANAVGIAVEDTSFRVWVRQVRIRAYTGTGAVGLLLHNKTANQFVEGFQTDDVSFSNNTTGIEFRRTGGTASFNGTNLRGVAMNVTANQTGILIGGALSTGGECRIYNSFIQAQIWLDGNNACGVRNGANGFVTWTDTEIKGEEAGGVTGIIDLRNDEGGQWWTTGVFKFDTARRQVTIANTSTHVIWTENQQANSGGIILAQGADRTGGAVLQVRTYNNSDPKKPSSVQRAQIADDGSLDARNIGAGTNNWQGMLGGFAFREVETAPTSDPSTGALAYVQSGVVKVHDTAGKKYELSTRRKSAMPGVVLPILFDTPQILGTAGVALNTIRLARAIVPMTGTLHDLTIWVGTAAGNVIGMVYDTNDALAGSRTKLWDSGSVAAAGSSAWQVIGDPNLAVTAGQQIELAVISDNTGLVLGRQSLAAAASAALPTNFNVVAGGASPKLMATYTPGSFTAPSTLAEASVAATNLAVFLMARVS